MKSTTLVDFCQQACWITKFTSYLQDARLGCSLKSELERAHIFKALSPMNKKRPINQSYTKPLTIHEGDSILTQCILL